MFLDKFIYFIDHRAEPRFTIYKVVGEHFQIQRTQSTFPKLFIFCFVFFISGSHSFFLTCQKSVGGEFSEICDNADASLNKSNLSHFPAPNHNVDAESRLESSPSSDSGA